MSDDKSIYELLQMEHSKSVLFLLILSLFSTLKSIELLALNFTKTVAQGKCPA